MKTDQTPLPLAVNDSQLAAPKQNKSPLEELLSQAMAQGKDPAFFRELLAVRRDWEADEARKAFNVATSEFQRRAPIIPKDDAGQNSKYAKLDRIWRTIRPILTPIGLSVTWQICELKDGNLCHVEGKLSHRDGHHERITFDVPIPEVIKNREGRSVTNVAQQMGSAHTYAQRYATCSALGLITGEDDDGTKAGGDYVTTEQAAELDELIDAARGVDGWDESKFVAWIKADCTADIAAARYNDVKRFLSSKLKGTQ